MTIFPTRILFASDGSEDSELAATTAVGLAKVTGSDHLHLCVLRNLASSVKYPGASRFR